MEKFHLCSKRLRSSNRNVCCILLWSEINFLSYPMASYHNHWLCTQHATHRLNFEKIHYTDALIGYLHVCEHEWDVILAI